MDAPRFDQLTRRLTVASTRRRALGRVMMGGLAALLGVGIDADASEGKKKRRRRKRRKVRGEGPCGNGKGKANRCRRHRQCCTGYCHKRKRRCRCRRPGQSCNDDRNCCPERKGMACIEGTCQPGCPADRQCGSACCTPDQICANGQCQTPCPTEQVCGERCCPAGQTCVNGACELPCEAGGPCTVFVTSTTHQGDLGGLRGADAICQARAAAANLRGTFKAWLSDETGSPATRFTRSAGPYRLVNGTTIAANWADLTDGSLAHPIDRTEFNGGVGAAIRVCSDTNPNGACRSCASSENNCGRWMSADTSMGNFGEAVASNGHWTNRTNSVRCDGWEAELGGETYQYRLYCFQQP